MPETGTRGLIRPPGEPKMQNERGVENVAGGSLPLLPRQLARCPKAIFLGISGANGICSDPCACPPLSK